MAEYYKRRGGGVCQEKTFYMGREELRGVGYIGGTIHRRLHPPSSLNPGRGPGSGKRMLYCGAGPELVPGCDLNVL